MSAAVAPDALTKYLRRVVEDIGDEERARLFERFGRCAGDATLEDGSCERCTEKAVLDGACPDPAP